MTNSTRSFLSFLLSYRTDTYGPGPRWAILLFSFLPACLSVCLLCLTVWLQHLLTPSSPHETLFPCFFRPPTRLTPFNHPTTPYPPSVHQPLSTCALLLLLLLPFPFPPLFFLSFFFFSISFCTRLRILEDIEETTPLSHEKILPSRGQRSLFYSSSFYRH